MALHINLYNEIHQQAQARARDPRKLASLAGVLIVFFFLGYYLYRVDTVHRVEMKRAALADSWKKLAPEQEAAIAHKAELLAQQKINASLMDRLQGRFYWAPFLEKIGALVPSTVQITLLAGTYDKSKGANILLTGLVADSQPRSAAEQFRRSLQQTFTPLFTDVAASFDANSLEDGTDMAQVKGQLLPTARFRIRLVFKPTPPAAAATPAPQAAEPRKAR